MSLFQLSIHCHRTQLRQKRFQKTMNELLSCKKVKPVIWYELFLGSEIRHTLMCRLMEGDYHRAAGARIAGQLAQQR